MASGHAQRTLQPRRVSANRSRRLAERFAERAPEYDREARFPEPNLLDLRAAGLLGLTVPVEAGGAGAGPPAPAEPGSSSSALSWQERLELQLLRREVTPLLERAER